MNSNPSKFAWKFRIFQHIEWNKVGSNKLCPYEPLIKVCYSHYTVHVCVCVARDELLPKAECKVDDDHDDWNSSKWRPEQLTWGRQKLQIHVQGYINIYVGITDISMVYDKNIYNQYWAFIQQSNRNSRKFRTVIDKMNCRFFNNENQDPLVLLNKSWVSEIWYIEWTIGITVTQFTLHVLELGLTLLRFLDTPDAHPVSVWWTRIGICSGSSTTDLTCNKINSIIYHETCNTLVIPLWLGLLHY